MLARRDALAGATGCYRVVVLDHTSSNLATNLKRLREARGLTQLGLAELSGVPRPTLANLESGSANPTLSVLLKVADALQASVEQLIATTGATRYFPKRELPTKRRNNATVRQLLPDPIPGMAIERFELASGAKLSGAAGGPGTRHYLACESGEIELQVAGETWRLGPGDLLVLRGDQARVCQNRGRRRAVAYGVTAPALLGT